MDEGVRTMITVNREQGTDYLFAGFLDRELSKHIVDFDAVLNIEPKRGGEIYFCQDYTIALKDNPQIRYMFYALPSYRKDHYAMMGKNCAVVTYAADPLFHKPQQVEKIYDVGFIGTRYYPERNKYLEMIESLYYRSFCNLDTLPGEQIPQKLSQCKVLFNHTRPEIDVNLRFFEEMALGCQVMIRNQYLPEFATEGEHYLGYSSPEECAEVIKKLLEDENLRNKITYQARSHFLSNHTYAHRAQSIINCLTDYYARSKEDYVQTEG